MSNMQIRDDCASLGRDTVGPLPPPARYLLPSSDMPGHMPYAGTYMGAGYTPMPFNYTNDPSIYREESLSGIYSAYFTERNFMDFVFIIKFKFVFFFLW